MTKKIRPGITLHNVRGTNSHGNCKAVICSDNGKRWASALDCAEELGTCISTVSACCLGNTRTCKGLHLHYAYDDIVDPLCERIQEQQAKMELNQAELESKDFTIAAKQTEIDELRSKTNNTNNSIKAAMEYKRNAQKAWEDAQAAADAAKAEYEQATAQLNALLEKLF